jgi:hypothetical protein
VARARSEIFYHNKAIGLVIAAAEVGERLSVGVPDDIAARHGIGVPGRGKAAG